MTSTAGSTPARFPDRRAGGRALARLLAPAYAGRGDVTVLALPRGGVPVGVEVAAALGAALDVFLVRRLGAPGYPEYAMGAVASGGIRVLNHDVIRYLKVSREAIEAATAAEREELERRERAFRGERAREPELRDRTLLLVDDGLCTGATLRAAAVALRSRGPARIVAAVPTAWPLSRDDVLADVDEVVSVIWPDPFGTVSTWYEDFSNPSDEEVRQMLAAAR